MLFRRELTRLLSFVIGYSTISIPLYPNIIPNSFARNLPISTGANKLKYGTVEALVPIVSMRSHVLAAQNAVIKDLLTAEKELKALPSTEKEFKRYFDEYSEPVSYKQQYLDKNAFVVYYTQGFDGPNRPRIDSDDAKSTKESQQYGYRNDAWVAVDEALSEIAYLKDNNLQNQISEYKDLRKALRDAVTAFDNYLSISPSPDVESATQKSNF